MVRYICISRSYTLSSYTTLLENISYVLPMQIYPGTWILKSTTLLNENVCSPPYTQHNPLVMHKIQFIHDPMYIFSKLQPELSARTIPFVVSCSSLQTHIPTDIHSRSILICFEYKRTIEEHLQKIYGYKQSSASHFSYTHYAFPAAFTFYAYKHIYNDTTLGLLTCIFQ